MNIVVVTPSWPQVANPNGIVTYYTNLVPALREQGHTVHVVTFEVYKEDSHTHLIDYKLSFVEKALCKLREYVDPGYWQYYYGSRSICHKIQEIHEASSVDVVQMEDSFGWHYFVQKKLPIPVVNRLHGPYFLNSFETIKSRQTHRRITREARAFLAAKYITSPSVNILKSTEKKYGKFWCESKALPNSMNIFQYDDRWEFASITKWQILFVGRFDNHKGGDVILHAFFKVKKKLPDATLVFIGPDKGLEAGGEIVTVKKFMNLHGYEAEIDRSVFFKGKQDKKTINSYRKSSHLTVVSSRYETFGNVALEAIACGSPLVCSDAGALPEIIQHKKSGVLFENENVDDLAEKMEAVLYSDELANTLSDGGLERAESVFSPASAAAAMVDFFNRIVQVDKN